MTSWLIILGYSIPALALALFGFLGYTLRICFGFKKPSRTTGAEHHLGSQGISENTDRPETNAVRYSIPSSQMVPSVPSLAQEQSTMAIMFPNTGEPQDRASELTNILPSFRSEDSLMTDNCAICLDTLANSQVTLMACMHAIHSECLLGWLSKSQRESCPICRSSILT